MSDSRRPCGKSEVTTREKNQEDGSICSKREWVQFPWPVKGGMKSTNAGCKDIFIRTSVERWIVIHPTLHLSFPEDEQWSFNNNNNKLCSQPGRAKHREPPYWCPSHDSDMTGQPSAGAGHTSQTLLQSHAANVMVQQLINLTMHTQGDMPALPRPSFSVSQFSRSLIMGK